MYILFLGLVFEIPGHSYEADADDTPLLVERNGNVQIQVCTEQRNEMVSQTRDSDDMGQCMPFILLGLIFCLVHSFLEFVMNMNAFNSFAIFAMCGVSRICFWLFSITNIVIEFHLLNKMKSKHLGYQVSIVLVLIPTFTLFIDTLYFLIRRIEFLCDDGNDFGPKISLTGSRLIAYGTLTCLDGFFHMVHNYLQTSLLLHVSHFDFSSLANHDSRQYNWFKTILVNLIQINFSMWLVDSFTLYSAADLFMIKHINENGINEHIVSGITDPLHIYYRFHSAIQFLIWYFET